MGSCAASSGGTRDTGAVTISLPRPWLPVVIDMQRLFAEDTVWHTPSTGRVVVPIRHLVEHFGDAVFTRFMTPESPSEARGTWGSYYEHWAELTTAVMDPEMLDVMPELSDLAARSKVCDKTTHSAFNSGDFDRVLFESGAETVVLAGVETDVCVLATAMDAIDRGYGVVIASDAVTSSDEASHRACLDLVYPRFDQQVRLMSVAEIGVGYRS